MLAPDMIRVKRRGEVLRLDPLKGDDRERALEMADEILTLLQGSEGLSEEELRQELLGVLHDAKETKLLQGLIKVALDQCDFGPSVEADAVEVRRVVFSEASRTRARLDDGQGLNRNLILSRVASELNLTAEAIEAALFADLKGAALLRRAPSWRGTKLLEAYDLAALQGVFLSAAELEIRLTRTEGPSVRALFRALKFRELLFSIQESANGGYDVTVSGPMSVFGPRTRYGLRLAQLIPDLAQLNGVRLSAKLSWGRDKKPLRFEWSPSPDAEVDASVSEAPGWAPPLLQLSASPALSASGWVIEPAERIFAVPGIGVCVPDAVCKRPGSEDVYLELLGYWSREAVFRRIDFASALQRERFVFLVPARLRVSEEVVPDGVATCLHVFKGTILPKRLVDQLNQLAANP